MKIDLTHLNDLFDTHGITKLGVKRIIDVQENTPFRSVRASKAGKNRTIRFPSRKTGIVVEAESETLEFAGILKCETSKHVYWYGTQLPPIHLQYKTGKRNVSVYRSLDLFVISNDFIGYIEWKTKKELMKISKRSPGFIRYDKDLDEFFSDAIEQSLEGTELAYKICFERHANENERINLEFLHGYYLHPPTKEMIGRAEKVRALIKDEQGVHIQELIEIMGEADPVYYAITLELIFIPITKIKLIDTIFAIVFRCEEDCLNFVPDIERICESDHRIKLSDAIMFSSDLAVANARKRLDIIEKLKDRMISIGQAMELAGRSQRTVERWKKAIEGLKGRSEKISALINADFKKGNRSDRLVMQKEIIKKNIEQYYLTKEARSKADVIARIQTECKKNNLPVVSERSLYIRIREIDTIYAQRVRFGEKYAYQNSAFELWDIDKKYRLGATRFLQYCHVDHTVVDVQVFDEYGYELPSESRPSLVMIIDEFSSFVLGWFLSFSKPSYVNVMMAIRDMVARHQCLPETIVVDGGNEFHGNDFELLAARKIYSIKSREGQPRGGLVIERMFGKINTEFFHNIEGNTKMMKDVRKVSSTHNPDNTKKWTIIHFVVMLDAYVNFHNEHGIKGFSLTPLKLKEYSLNKLGNREYLSQQYDDDFVFSTMPYIKRRSVTLHRGGNITHDHHEYWNPSFNSIKQETMKVEVKWDPMNLQRVFAYVEKRWVECRIVNNFNRSFDHAKVARSQELRNSVKLSNKAKRLVRRDIPDVLDDALSLADGIQMDMSFEKHSNVEEAANLDISLEEMWGMDVNDVIRKEDAK